MKFSNLNHSSLNCHWDKMCNGLEEHNKSIVKTNTSFISDLLKELSKSQAKAQAEADSKCILQKELSQI